ncbi:MAG: CoxG family protein [Ruegeria sp.]
MELADEIVINAPKDQVYAALNDPDILRQCIPGCEELIKHSDTELEAKVVLKIGPVKARFSGDVQLDTTGAPDTFSLTGQGNGGSAGHAKGGADVTLTADGPDSTILRYKAEAAIGGKLAQLGSRLIQSTAKKLAAKFFKSFADVVNEYTAA